MLALATSLRDTSGAVIFSADIGARLEPFKDLERFLSLACDDARLVLFFYDLCDDYFQAEHLNLLEGLLRSRISERSDEIENAVSALSALQDSVLHRWKNNFGALKHADW